MKPASPKRSLPWAKWLYEWAGNPLEWSLVDKCLLAVVVNLCFVIPYALWVQFSFDEPSLAPYLDADVAGTVQILFWARVAGWALILLAGLWFRKHRPENKTFVVVTLNYFAILTAVYSYYLEPFVTPFVVAFVGAAILGLLLFDQALIMACLVVALLIRGTISLAIQCHWIPFAPLFHNKPFGESGQPTLWFLPMSGGSLLIGLAAFVAMVLIIDRWHDREARLEKVSRTDDLTRLSNRRHFTESLEREFLRAQRLQRPLGLLMCDVDHFKKVNDTWGHKKGDEVLRAIARILDDTVRGGIDLPGRIGGEEFAVLLVETDLATSEIIARRIADTVRKLRFDDSRGGPAGVTISIGVTAIEDAVKDPDTLLEVADTLLYRAKRLGRNRVETGLLSALAAGDDGAD